MEDSDLGGWPTKRQVVWRLDDGRGRREEIEMVLEEPLALIINGRQAAVLMRLPGMEKELATGFCLSEGLVAGFDDLLTVHHCGQGLPDPGQDEGETRESRNRVTMRVRPEALDEDARLAVVRLIRAGCGAVDGDVGELGLPALLSGPVISAEVLHGMGAALREAQGLHRHAGGVHAAGLFDREGRLLIAAEDVGRHNAMDKAVGWCLLRGLPLDDKLLLSSGRLSYEMAAKAIRLGLPLLASASAPTALAVELAERYNLTLVGYLRGSRLTVYTHPERIAGALSG